MLFKERNIWITTMIFLAIIVIINLLAGTLFFRLDLTENEKYSISDVTRKVLADIDDPVTVKIYTSEKFPSQLVSVRQYVMDMLEEYRAYAGTGLEYEFIELSGEDEDMEQEAMSYGVMPVQANITERDEIKVSKIYLGMVFLYGDGKEVIPFANRVDQLEYDMTGALKKLISAETPSVGWLTGHGEPELFGDQAVERALSEIRKNYELRNVNLASEASIPNDLSVALLVNPNQEFDVAALYKLDQFIMRGGKLGLFIGSKDIDLSRQYVPVLDNRTNTNEFFSNFGFRIDERLILDRQCFNVQAMQNLGMIQIPVSVQYPFAPKITDLDGENPIVSRMSEVGFFFISEIVSTPGESGGEVQFTPLLKTSAKTGYAMPDPRMRTIDINPGTEMPEFLFTESSKPVAASLKGNFNSYFGASRPDSIDYPEPHLSRSQSPSRMVVTGSGTLVKQQFMIPSALTYFLNTVDWLYDEYGLISIRSKEIAPKELDETSPGTRTLIKWLNILLAPILIVGFGIVRWLTRKRAKQLAGGAS